MYQPLSGHAKYRSTDYFQCKFNCNNKCYFLWNRSNYYYMDSCSCTSNTVVKGFFSVSSVVIYYSNYWLDIKYWCSFYYHLYQMIGNVDWINNASAKFWWGSTCPYNVTHKGERTHKLAYSPPQIHNLYLFVTNCRFFFKGCVEWR